LSGTTKQSRRFPPLFDTVSKSLYQYNEFDFPLVIFRDFPLFFVTEKPAAYRAFRPPKCLVTFLASRRVMGYLAFTISSVFPTHIAK